MARLTEDEHATLRVRYNEYPSRTPVPPVYPPLRRRRGLSPEQQAAIEEPGLGALPKGGLSGAPSVKIWSVFLEEDLVNQGIQIGSPRFVGPGLLHSFTGQIDVTAQGLTFDPLHLTYSPAPVPTVKGFTTPTPPPGTPVSALTVEQASITPTPVTSSGMIFERDFGDNIITIPLGVYIPLNEFYLGLSLFARATVAIIYGNFRIIESAPPESVSW